MGSDWSNRGSGRDRVALPLPHRRMTEFNIKDTVASGVTGTWAHGLYVATTILLAMNTNASRISALNVFCSIKDAQLGTLFQGKYE